MTSGYVCAPPFAHTSGPRDAKLVLVGEAWGEQEELLGKPFLGSSGTLLTSLMREAGLRRSDCLLTNVLALRPRENNLAHVCGKKSELGKDYALPPLKQGQYLLPEYFGELERLREELRVVRPNLVVGLGATACWALFGRGNISSVRGTTALTCGPAAPPDLKALCTYHPAYILRKWEHRVVALADLIKAKFECKFPEIRRPHRHVLVAPTLQEIREFYANFRTCRRLSVDIETTSGMIDCIGFGPTPTTSLVISFMTGLKSFWNSAEEESEAWELVQALLDLPCEKTFQNGLFDLSYLLRMGLTVRNVANDTMLLHHALYPELQKGLGFLGSLYSNEASWKLMRAKGQEELKRDE